MAKLIGFVVAAAVALFLVKSLGFLVGILVSALVAPILQILVSGLCTQIGKTLGFTSAPIAEENESELAARSAAAAAEKIDDALHNRAVSELNSLKSGLWSQCLANAAGNENAARIEYLRLRKAELFDEQKQLDMAGAELKRVTDPEQSAKCPCCERLVTMGDAKCPYCRASFGPGSPYKLTPQ